MNNCLNLNNFDGEILENEPMSKHTTYKIGGPAKYFAIANNTESLKKLFSYCKQNDLDWYILGNGSNVLVSDDGIDGLVIVLDGDFKDIKYFQNDNSYFVGGAVLLSKFANECFKNNCGGFEWAIGIPGSIGGAVKMNAGAKGQCIADCLISCDVIDAEGNIENKKASDIDWAYRHSSIKNDEIVSFAKFSVCSFNSDADKDEAENKIKDYKESRRASQPLNYPNCGSVFKNPDGLSAGKLIDDAGLKAFTIGGAQVSNKHANFIVNIGDAKASDVVELIQKVQEIVYNKSGVKLRPELKFLGFKKNCSLY